MKLTNVTFIIFMAFILSCGNSHHTDNPIMQKAFAIHQEASKIEKEIAPKLEDLIQTKNNADINRVKKIEQIEQSVKYWRENLPDVPGFAHEHHAHEGPCNHGPKLELLPEDWVKVQQDFKDSILVIKERIEAIF